MDNVGAIPILQFDFKWMKKKGRIVGFLHYISPFFHLFSFVAKCHTTPQCPKKIANHKYLSFLGGMIKKNDLRNKKSTQYPLITTHTP